MNRLKTACHVFLLIGPSALGLAMAQPAAAQELTFTLTGITFNDGATASGYFDYNPANNTFGLFDIVTTPGTTDPFPGVVYDKATTYGVFPFHANTAFIFASSVYPSNDTLIFNTKTATDKPGVYTLYPGQLFVSPKGLSGSGEVASDTTGTGGATQFRGITGGTLNAAPTSVPEPSSLAACGLGALGLGGLLRARRKKAARAA